MMELDQSAPPVQATGLPDSVLRQSLAHFNTLAEGVHVEAGIPEAGTSGWFPLARLADADFGNKVIRRIGDQTSATPQAAATYTLRYAFYTPLMLAGYLFASQQRVFLLHDNLLVANRDWLNHICLPVPAAVVLPADKLAGQPGIRTVADQNQLAGILFDEMRCLVEPLIERWSARKLVGRPNAWAIAIDSLAYGFTLAGRHGVGLDEAWAMWDKVIAGRVFPVRRRPRRFQFTIDGETDELLIRSGCCLWFTQTAPENGPLRYCTSCYIESDARRLEIITAGRRDKPTDD